MRKRGVMKMPNGGFNPAVNVQLAADTESRAIVGVEVSNGRFGRGGVECADAGAGGTAHGRQGARNTCWTAATCGTDDIEAAARSRAWRCSCRRKAAQESRAAGARNWSPKPGDSEAVQAWKQRMRSAEGKQIYKQRAATSETVNADLRTYRGLSR